MLDVVRIDCNSCVITWAVRQSASGDRETAQRSDEGGAREDSAQESPSKCSVASHRDGETAQLVLDAAFSVCVCVCVGM